MENSSFNCDSIFLIPIDKNEAQLIMTNNANNKKLSNNIEYNTLASKLTKNDRADSSKIYISEIFCKNWKIKIKRLNTKTFVKLEREMNKYKYKFK